MKVLIVDDVHPHLIQNLESAGFEVLYKPDINRSDALQLMSEIQILVVRSKFKIDQSVLENAPELLMIARAGAGLDNVDIALAKLKNIEVFHAAEGNADAVGEHTLGMILCLLSKLASADRSVRAGNWDREKFRGTELKSKTVGLIGYGNMGRAVASRLSSFGCKIIAYDKYLEDWPDQNAERVDLQTLFSDSQILSLHIPLTSETKGWITTGFLKNFQKGLVLINTSRGEIVPLDGICRLLEVGELSGLGLDVLEDEPPLKISGSITPKYQSLFLREDVLLSPHVAGWTIESYVKISEVLAGKILQHFSGLKN